MHRLDYQKGEADQWHHSYNYDADNRITDVYTTASTPLMDGLTGISSLQNEPVISTYWEREASYNYYEHGPLARTTLGQ